MSILTPDDILNMVKASNIDFVFMQFTDILGMTKSITIPTEQLSKALCDGITFDGSSIDGFVRIEESDMVLRPDIDTFCILPWRGAGTKSARIICDVFCADKTPFVGDPRFAVKRAAAEAEKMGFVANFGPECEFFLFQLDENGRPTTNSLDRGGYFDFGPVDRGEECRRDICLALSKLGFKIEASHHENAMAQHEIDWGYDEILKTADNVQTMKYVTKTVAAQHGLFATFLPKPIYGQSGSGMHTNISLFKDGSNAFFDASDKYGLSKVAYSFIAGVLNHISEMTLILNPLVNSYKRFVPGFEAPIHIAWSAQNRSPLIRIPSATGERKRIELRSPDPSCNPYLEMAAVLFAGLEGVKNEEVPCAPIDKDVYSVSDTEITQFGIETLPTNMGEAISRFENSAFLRQKLGNHIFSKFLSAKKEEWNEYMSRVSSWELEKYLGKY